MYEQHDDSSWSFAIGLLIGSALGAAVASLFSPRSGQQNREAVREQGLVLKSRVTNATNTAATSVKDTRNIVVARVSDTAATVKEKASSAVETVSETASTAAATVKEKASSAVETVSETASTAAATVKEKASSAVETVSETASTAAAKVQDVASTAAARVSETATTVKEKASSAVETVSETASTAAAKVQDVASTAAEKARTLTQGSAAPASDEIVVASVGQLAHEASYDAEDARPATTENASATLAADIASVNPRPASADRPIDTSGLGGVEGATLEDDLLTSSAIESSAGATETLESEIGATETLAIEDDLVRPEAFAAPDAATTEALAELSSDEQFEVDASTAAGSDADVREASEGAERRA